MYVYVDEVKSQNAYDDENEEQTKVRHRRNITFARIAKELNIFYSTKQQCSVYAVFFPRAVS